MSLMNKLHEILEVVKQIRYAQEHGDSCQQLTNLVTQLSQKVAEQSSKLDLLEQQVVEQGAQLQLVEDHVEEILATLSGQFRSLEIKYFDQNGNPIPKETGMPLQMTDIQSVSATVSEVDAAGNPVPLDLTANTVAWTVSDPTILTLTQNPDGSASIKAAGKLGASQVAVSATPTAGGTALNVQDTITVVNSAATGLAIQFGTPA
jgi:hypothetical protein